jgi:elongation factor 1-alpha
MSKILKGSACNLKPFLVKDDTGIDVIANLMPNKTVCPIFPISNVTGQGIPILKLFLSKLPNYDNAGGPEDKELNDS